ncbi:hypothetical protein MMC11_008306, partial [Xylographa trunciseda]|nr:hypothetical protein [Xylographa trunciseda]
MEPRQTPDDRHLGYEKPTASYRAPRISDEEWDRWREKIVHLYIVENKSRKEVVEAMANEHGFSITEKQLKHRLQKWRVKKYLGVEDRETLVSLKRKWHNRNKDPVLEYRGHVIDAARLKRVYKRSKGLIASPLMVSSHIKAVGTLSPSPPPIEADISANENETVAPVPLVSGANFIQSEDFSLRNAMDTTPEWALGIFDEDITDRNYLQASQTFCDNPDASMMDFSVPVLGPNHLLSWDDGPHNLETEQHHITWEAYGSVMTYATTKSSLGHSDNSLSCFLNSPPTEDHELNMRGLEFESSPKSPRSLRSPSRGVVMLQSRTTNPVNAHPSCELSSTIFPKATVYEQGLDHAIFLSTDPEMVIMSLLLLQKAISPLLGASTHKVRYINSSTSRDLANIVDSNWLRSEIENLVCLGHEAASSSIRQRQALKPSRESGENAELLVEDHSNDVLASLTHAPRSKCSDYFVYNLPTGNLRIQLNEVSKEHSGFVNGEISYKTQVYFVPNPQICTTGVSAFFSRINMTHGSVPAQITTFNVVPQDAEIIRCVSKRDIEGVRRLFDRKQASARDVDPDGFSLLSYAMNPRCFDVYVFRLLIESGAGTENCNVWGHSMSVLWALWEYLIVMPMFTDSLTLDSVKSLSNIALNKGCEFEDSRTYNDKFPNVLFGALGNTEVAVSIDIIDALLDYGCWIEQKNCEGRTPFLFAALLFWREGTVNKIRALLRRRANPHEIDHYGQGALHVVLCSTTYSTFNDIDFLKIYSVSAQKLEHIDYLLLGGDGLQQDDCDNLDSAFYEDLETSQLRSKRANGSGAGIQFEDHHAESASNANDDSDSDDSDNDDREGDNNCEIYYCNSASHYCKCPDHGLERREELHQIFQIRLRLILVELLQIGCDPNLLDFEGK